MSDDSFGTDDFSPSIPFPISCLSTRKSNRYMLYDIKLISWLRREQHILGVLIGSLPQAPSQNVFLGLPLELMPEEARLLVEKKLAFITNDRVWHMNAVHGGAPISKVRDYQAAVRIRGLQAADAARKLKEAKLEEVMKKLSLNDEVKHKHQNDLKQVLQGSLIETDDSLFGTSDISSQIQYRASLPEVEILATTPTTSGLLGPADKSVETPEINAPSFALFKMLHDQGYFLSPGLRFGCQYMAYPGDPLRYHSHFLVVASDWTTGIDLIDIIGSGRLATGVKKSFLLGGMEPSTSSSKPTTTTRAFSLEWAGM